MLRGVANGIMTETVLYKEHKMEYRSLKNTGAHDVKIQGTGLGKNCNKILHFSTPSRFQTILSAFHTAGILYIL
jgi:hypothetical protein